MRHRLLILACVVAPGCASRGTLRPRADEPRYSRIGILRTSVPADALLRQARARLDSALAARGPAVALRLVQAARADAERATAPKAPGQPWAAGETVFFTYAEEARWRAVALGARARCEDARAVAALVDAAVQRLPGSCERFCSARYQATLQQLAEAKRTADRTGARGCSAGRGALNGRTEG